jgi:endonuclease IV
MAATAETLEYKHTAIELFGPHIHREYKGANTLTEHMLAAIKQAAEHDVVVGVVQVFISDPRSRKLCVFDNKLASALKEHNIIGFAHGTYSDVPWSDKDWVAKKAVKFIRVEMVALSAQGLVGLIIHLPCNGDFHKTAKGIKNVFAEDFDSGAILYLETPATKPEKSVWHKPESYGKLLQMLSKKDMARVGICVDTAHLHACGVDLRNYDDARAWFEEFYEVVFPLIGNRIFIHFNDSKSELGSGIDIHEALGAGTIWKDVDICASGIRAVVEFVRARRIPAVFERNGADPYPTDYIALHSVCPLA